MVPGGTTESIAHFIGYLHLIQDTVRGHQTLDGAPPPARSQDWSDAGHRTGHPDLTLDDLQSQPLAKPYGPGGFSLIDVAKHKVLPPPPIAAPHPHLGHVPPVDADPHDPGLPAVGVSFIQIDVDRIADGVHPAPLPDQLLADIVQANVLQNDGIAITAPLTPGFATLTLTHDADALPHLPVLLAEAEANTPDWLADAGQGQGLIKAVAAHDADPASHAAAPVPPGLYADGVAQPAGTPFDPTLPATVTPAATSHNGMVDPGADAHTGGNTAINLASILDDHTEHTGFVVMGDSYTTDAIVQTNVLHSLADIALGSLSGPQSVETGNNTAHNLAQFAFHDIASGFVSANMPWAHLQLDTINGDFYDVKALSQTNYISNNDMVMQSASSAYSEIASGGNLQVNDLSFSELAQHYDLIVVGGSYHNTNVIIQQNVFLNDAVIRMLSGRGDAEGQTVTSGDNSLSNKASIDHYGTTVTQPLTTDLAGWLGRVESGSWSPEDGSPLPSIGSSLMHVLYITGDFFDINALSQTNIVSNVDTVAQFMPHVDSGTAPTGMPTTSTMAIDAGHNQLANLAGISVVGTTSPFQFVGGQHYDDAILVQANLVSDKASVVIGDTHSLANELIAFTGQHDAVVSAPDHVTTPQTDPSLHHDLFHGIMT